MIWMGIRSFPLTQKVMCTSFCRIQAEAEDGLTLVPPVSDQVWWSGEWYRARLQYVASPRGDGLHRLGRDRPGRRRPAERLRRCFDVPLPRHCDGKKLRQHVQLLTHIHKALCRNFLSREEARDCLAFQVYEEANQLALLVFRLHLEDLALE